MNTLESTVEFFTKHQNCKANIEEVDILKGIITFTDINGDKHRINTEKEIVLYAPSVREKFIFVKPVICFLSCEQEFDNGEEYYNDESGEYEYSSSVSTYVIENLYIFYQVIGKIKSLNLAYPIAFNKKTSIMEQTIQPSNMESISNCNGIAPSDTVEFFKSLIVAAPSYYGNATENPDSFIRRVFIDGKIYTNDEIDNIPLKKTLFIDRLFSGGMESGRRYSAERTLSLEDTNYSPLFKGLSVFRQNFVAKPIQMYNNALPSLDIKDFVYNDINTFIAQNRAINLNLAIIKSLKIDYKKRLVNTDGIISLPKLTNHPDCCGAHLSYGHGHGGGNNYQENNSRLTDKLYLTYLKFNRADKTIFLVENQVKHSIPLYKKMYGKDNVLEIGKYMNMNSGNYIYIYNINTTKRFMDSDLFTIKEESPEGGWAIRNNISSAVQKFSSSCETDFELAQWFENSEEVVTPKKKPIKTIRETATNRVRREAVINSNLYY